VRKSTACCAGSRDLVVSCMHHVRSLAQGPENRHSADTVFNIGVTAQLSGDVRGAEAHFRRALKLYRRFLAADHPAIGRAQQRIAQCRGEL
jgi:hypothetical protein